MNKNRKKLKNISPLLSSNVDVIKIKNKIIVGVLTTPKSSINYPLPQGKDSRLKMELITYAAKKGIFLYFFYPYGIDWDRQKVIAHTYKMVSSKRGEWVTGKFPLPNIVYNRLSFRKDENQKDVQELLHRLEQNPQIYLFNSRFLNKWEVYSALSQNNLTWSLIPETRIFNRTNLSTMLIKYPELFLKPSNNSVGKGIIKIERKSSTNRYLYKSANSIADWNSCSSIDQLYHQLKPIIKNEDKYLIQKGIDLATFEGRVFDMRVEVQKNGKGKWVLTGVGARIAAPGKFVTHVPNGGSKAKYDEVVKKAFRNITKENLDRQLLNICCTVPYVLEQNLAITLGIISIDIGVDKTGTMQIIEVNSKPASFDENDIRERHLENLTDYFLYLTNVPNMFCRED